MVALVLSALCALLFLRFFGRIIRAVVKALGIAILAAILLQLADTGTVELGRLTPSRAQLQTLTELVSEIAAVAQRYELHVELRERRGDTPAPLDGLKGWIGELRPLSAQQ